jgi:hypothetical protein
MPVFDWQFVVVTLIAAGGLWTLVRRFVPARQSRGARDAQGASGSSLSLPQKPTACAHCASNPAADDGERHQPQSRQPRRTETVPVVALRDLRASARPPRRTGHR